MIITKKHMFIALVFIIAFITAAVLYRSVCLFKEVRETSANRYTVVIDPGHGSPDGGAVGASGVMEKDINLAISLKLREVLEGMGFHVVMTREGDSGLQDSGAATIREMKVSDMHKRLDIVKDSRADLFLSIHMNSFGDSSVSGLHIFYDKNHPEAEEIAKRIQARISKATGAAAHTVKTADESLFLMKNAPIPSVLAECGFLSNPQEEELLTDDGYQSKIAWAIAKALAEGAIPYAN